MDRRLLRAVAEALTRGQFECSQEEVADAYRQVQDARIKGAAAEMVLQGRLDLALKDGEIHFLNPATSTTVGLDPDRPLDPYAAAREQGGIIALDVWPGSDGPVMLVAEQLPEPDDLEGEEPQECFTFTLVDLNRDLDLLSFSVPLRDLMRLVARAPIRSSDSDEDTQSPAPT